MHANGQEPVGKLITVREAAAFARVSVDTIYAAIADGSLRAVRLGRGRTRGKFWIRPAAVDAWLEAREGQTVREMKERR